MADYTILQPRQIEHIERTLQFESFYKTWGYKYLQAHGLIDPVGEGLINVESTVFKKSEKSVLSYSGTQNLPDSVAKLTTVTSKMALLGIKLIINKTSMDAWVNNKSGIAAGTTLPTVMIAEQVQQLFNQVDAFIFWGDAFNVFRAGDEWHDAGEWTGMFNGFTTKPSGAGSDENVTAAGDYVATVDSYIISLKDAGWDSDQYFIFSDLLTWQAAGKGNNFSSTTLTTERDRVIQRTDVAAWIASPNAYDGTNSRIIVTSPSRSMTSRERTPRTRPYRLLEGYKFRVYPLFGGGMDENMNFQIAILWSGVMEETHADAIYRSGNQTLA